MAQEAFAHAVWAALSSAEDHFARLGGQNRYVGFDDTHPAMYIVALLAANSFATGCEFKPTRGGLRTALQTLESQSPRLWQAMCSLEPWNAARFPDSLLTAAWQPLVGLCPTEADIRDFVRYADSRLPQGQGRQRDAFREACREIVGRKAGAPPGT
jgi:hypothetical protein